ncbi:hypothetical protein F4820DRAFT_406659 [Hypoxylon rubiginosum]|uniref:Uncharacterized protein n=1 Tax=Hypoxylon rubiginosum TaxID=110542 RepID=A0ACB9ZCC7_9PEZI|nr:hypothetical protein F4820DRAFT_406659 [Hypoxylon rubiginosum]
MSIIIFRQTLGSALFASPGYAVVTKKRPSSGKGWSPNQSWASRNVARYMYDTCRHRPSLFQSRRRSGRPGWYARQVQQAAGCLASKTQRVDQPSFLQDYSFPYPSPSRGGPQTRP